MASRLALIAPFVLMTLRGCTGPPPISATSAERLRDSIGVNLHLEYDDTLYATKAKTAQALQFLGVYHVRDAAMRSGSGREARFADLARAGARFDLFVSLDITAQLAAAQRLARLSAGSVEMLEGPNEANHEPFDSRGAGDDKAVQSYQARLYGTAHRTPSLQALPVAAFTYWPPLAARADMANFHAYPNLKRPLSAQLGWMRGMTEALQPLGSPVVCTETGFTTGGTDHVSEEQQAELEPVLLLENFRAHVQRTYLYELYDEHPDATAKPADRENHWGLFRSDGSPKPAAYAVQRMVALLDPGPTHGRPQPWVHVSGSHLQSLRVSSADGRRLTFLWSTDAQAFHAGDLAIDLRGAQTARLVNLAKGKVLVLPPGRSQAPLGPGVIVIVQGPQWRETNMPPLRDAQSGQHL